MHSICLFGCQCLQIILLTNYLELTRFYDIQALMLLVSKISGCNIQFHSTFWLNPELELDIRYIPTFITILSC